MCTGTFNPVWVDVPESRERAADVVWVWVRLSAEVREEEMMMGLDMVRLYEGRKGREGRRAGAEALAVSTPSTQGRTRLGVMEEQGGPALAFSTASDMHEDSKRRGESRS